MTYEYSNPYTSSYAPNGFENQNQQGISPVFQNTLGQQQYLANQLREEQQLGHHNQNGGGGSSGMNPMDLAKMLKNTPSQPNSQNPAPITDNSTPMSQYTGIDQWLADGGGSYGGGMNDALGQMGFDTGGFSGAGDFSMGGAGDSLSGAGDSLSGLGDMFSGIGGWFSGIDWGGIGAGAATAAEEAAPAAAAA